MWFSLVKCSAKCYLAEDSHICHGRGKQKRCSGFREVLTETAWEGGGGHHRLLAVLDHGACYRVAAGAVEAPRVSAHC